MPKVPGGSLPVFCPEKGVSEQWVKGEYWAAKWEKLLEGLSRSELSIVAAVALAKREAAEKGMVR